MGRERGKAHPRAPGASSSSCVSTVSRSAGWSWKNIDGVEPSEGIRQNLEQLQKKEFIEPYLSTMQWVMAGNDTEGLRYATVDSDIYLTWREDGAHARSAE